MSWKEELRKEDGKWKTILDIITNPRVEIKDEQEGKTERKKAKTGEMDGEREMNR